MVMNEVGGGGLKEGLYENVLFNQSRLLQLIRLSLC